MGKFVKYILKPGYFAVKKIAPKFADAIKRYYYYNGEIPILDKLKFIIRKNARIEYVNDIILSKKELRNVDNIDGRYKIAFVSPLPPQKSGIADYSAELLHGMKKYFNIDIYTDCKNCSDNYIKENFNIYHYSSLMNNKLKYSAVVYQFGNSKFHSYMYELIKEIPGIVVMHDFYLGGMIYYLAYVEKHKSIMSENLLYSHGFKSLYERNTEGLNYVIDKYPINKVILDNSTGVIFHSSYCSKLVKEFYSNTDYNEFIVNQVINEKPSKISSRGQLRKEFGFAENDIIISSFGFLGPSKLNHILLKAFTLLTSKDSFHNYKLVFVGNLSDEEYRELLNSICPITGDNICITGFVSEVDYEKYMVISDISVQLRSNSRGETSRAVLSSLVHGLPTIVNDYATFKDYPDNVVIKISDRNDIIELSDTIMRLVKETELYKSYAVNGRKYVLDFHNYDIVSQGYYNAIKSVITSMNKYQVDCEHKRKVLCYMSGENWRRLISFNPYDDNMIELVHIIGFSKGYAVTNINGKVGFKVCREDIVVSDIDICNNGFSQYANANDIKYYIYMPTLDNILSVINDNVVGFISERSFCDIEDKSVYSYTSFWNFVYGEDIQIEGKQIMVDVSHTSRYDDGSGIPRVVNNIFSNMSRKQGVIPLQYNGNGFVSAEGFLQKINDRRCFTSPVKIEIHDGDTWFLLDCPWNLADIFEERIKKIKNVETYAIVYDILPLQIPEYFRNESDIQAFKKWHDMLFQYIDNIVCISKATADAVINYFEKCQFDRNNSLNVYYYHQGASIEYGEIKNTKIRDELKEYVLSKKTFLMVGTVEPRKEHKTAIEAFKNINENQVQLLIIGHPGWNPEINDYVSKSCGNNVIWIKDATDAELCWAYKNSEALIAASKDEGFGLPLVEAAYWNLPIICSNIPVFHEVSQEKATFFNVLDSDDLSRVLKEWLNSDIHPSSSEIHIYSWKEATDEIMDILNERVKPYYVLK